MNATRRCPACRKPYKTDRGYDRHVATHADEDGRPICNCLLPVEAMGYKHQLACPVSWMEVEHVLTGAEPDGGCLVCDECDGNEGHDGPHDCGHDR